MAIAAGANAVGLVSAMPSGPGPIDDDLIATIARQIPPGVESVLLTSRQSARDVISQHRHARTTALQLVDAFPIDDYAPLRAALPGIRIIQVIHVLNGDSVAQAERIAPFVDAILLDSGNPSLPVKVLGGTGQVHDWNVSREIRERVPVPVFLAGGLNAGNVAEAITQVQPWAVDVCSGVRTNGRLDPQKLAAFVAAVKSTRSV